PPLGGELDVLEADAGQVELDQPAVGGAVHVGGRLPEALLEGAGRRQEQGMHKTDQIVSHRWHYLPPPAGLLNWMDKVGFWILPGLWYGKCCRVPVPFRPLDGPGAAADNGREPARVPLEVTDDPSAPPAGRRRPARPGPGRPARRRLPARRSQDRR